MGYTDKTRRDRGEGAEPKNFSGKVRTTLPNMSAYIVGARVIEHTCGT